MKPSNTDTQEIERAMDGEQEQSAEQAADFAALQAMADDAPAPPGTQPAEVKEAPDLATEIKAGITIAVGLLGPMYPSLKTVYTPEAVETAAGAVAAVCNKHGWLQGGMMGQYQEEIACFIVVGPLALATYQGVQADNAERERNKRAGQAIDMEKPEASDTPASASQGQKTVTFGAGQA